MLCEVCNAFKISAEDFIIKPDDESSRFEEHYNLGALSHIYQKAQSCPLCRLVVAAVGGSCLNNEGIYCELYWQDDGFVAGSDAPTVRCLGVRANPWPSGFNELNRLIPLAEDVTDSNGLFFGRKIGADRFNVKLMKKWIKSCRRWHGQHCDASLTDQKRGMSSRFKILDTWTRCLVLAPPNCTYLALSYVWGQRKFFTLTSSNIRNLERPGGLSEVWQDLPDTIQDAITLTSLLSVRYLWVDNLSILQDDRQEKKELISQMDLIYDRAFMTIVAANGDNADTGLRAFHAKNRGCRQNVEEIRPGLRLVCPKHVADNLNHSAYETRGWTYQERYLSNRCLYFFPDIVAFQCRHSTWREDVVLENCDVQNCLDMAGKFHLISSDLEPHEDYTGALYEYSHRTLTHESDIMEAFAGMSNVLHMRLNTDWSSRAFDVFGLPAVVFDWALLWEPNKLALRRQGAWPSWSWTGWCGGVGMLIHRITYSELQGWLSDHTWIQWKVYCTDDGRSVSLDTQQRDQSRWPANIYRPAVTAEPREVWAIAQSSVSHSNPANKMSSVFAGYQLLPLLHFAAPHVKFYLQALQSINGVGICYQVCDTAKIPQGLIWVNPAWDHHPNEAYEFIVLSDAKSGEMRQDLLPPAPNVKLSSDWDCYHVMLIERKSGLIPAERIGIGIVHQAALDNAVEPGVEWKEIWLR